MLTHTAWQSTIPSGREQFWSGGSRWLWIEDGILRGYRLAFPRPYPPAPWCPKPWSKTRKQA